MFNILSNGQWVRMPCSYEEEEEEEPWKRERGWCFKLAARSGFDWGRLIPTWLVHGY